MILCCLFCLAAAPATLPAIPPAAQTVSLIGHIQARDLAECSGLAASRRYPGVFWAHNDSGHRSVLFAITRDGKPLNEFGINAPSDDWEDIALDDAGQLYIADIGNNGLTRKHLQVYRLDEPDPAAPPPDKRLKPTAQWQLSFPAERIDAEAFFVYKEHGYLISKLYTGLPATLYRFPLNPKKGKPTLEVVATLPIHSPVTAASISPDGNRLAVLTYTGLNLFTINGDVASAGKVPPVYTRFLHHRIESCCFTDGGILVAAESREIYLFPDSPPNPQDPNR